MRCAKCLRVENPGLANSVWNALRRSRADARRATRRILRPQSFVLNAGNCSTVWMENPRTQMVPRLRRYNYAPRQTIPSLEGEKNAPKVHSEADIIALPAYFILDNHGAGHGPSIRRLSPKTPMNILG